MPYRSEDYPAEGELPWLDRPDAADAVARRVAAGEVTDEQAGWLQGWITDGYVVFEDMLDSAAIDAINAHVERVVAETAHLPLGERKKRFENLFGWSDPVRDALCRPELLARLDLLLGRRVVPYQTLNLPVSSQQLAHSDSILMTTHPRDHLIASWTALEDIDDGCGPLIVYPGSHRIPYVSAAEIGIPADVGEEECSRIYDAHYYARIASLVAEQALEPHPFLPQRGDVLVWHSNLLHGAQPVTRAGATRRSLIAHYFSEGVEVYSDLFQRGCLITEGLRPAGT